ncbi:hypothetical protein HAX54_029019, partial [Datura stramonium]|nr:hypothetical protein [Datura stramonium]
ATALNLCFVGASRIVISDSSMSHHLPLKFTCVLQSVVDSSAFRGSPSVFRCCLAGISSALHFRKF